MINVSDALFSKVQQCLLGVLFAHPEKSFYSNELIELAHSGRGAVQRELSRLVGSGLVNLKKVGNQNHYQANAASPVFNELRALILKTCGLSDIVKNVLAPIASNMEIAFIYGSVAKRQDRSESDIDLMVVSEIVDYAALFTVLENATVALGRPINPTVYSHKEFMRRIEQKNAFLIRVLAQPKIWLIGDESVLPFREAESNKSIHQS
jgi:predicted nucleotidyltransferase